MYTKEQLSIHEYFRKQLEQTELKNLLDPLTGLVGRPGMIGLARDWMEKGIPFAYAILDLDNFKFVRPLRRGRVPDSDSGAEDLRRAEGFPAEDV